MIMVSDIFFEILKGTMQRYIYIILGEKIRPAYSIPVAVENPKNVRCCQIFINLFAYFSCKEFHFQIININIAQCLS